MSQQATKLYEPAPHLTWFGAGPAGGVTRLTRSVVVGREPGTCDVLLESDLTSRRHARVEAGGGGVVELFDHGSSNGTFVNGRRVARVHLFYGDRVGFGSADVVHCVFRAAAPAPVIADGLAAGWPRPSDGTAGVERRPACGSCGTPARAGGGCHRCGARLTMDS